MFFSIITRQAIRRASFDSIPDLIDAIDTFIHAWNERCQPFAWTKPADQILEHRPPRLVRSSSALTVAGAPADVYEQR